MTTRATSNGGGAPCVVLIHGAWLGGWAWDPVIKLLRTCGIEACAPTLTGLGDRSHLMSPSVDLRTHVMDVVQSLRFIAAEKVVLVGHSYGGVIASEVAGEMPERVAALAVLDGFLGAAERSIVDSYPAMQALLDSLVSSRTAMLVPPPEPGLLTTSSDGMAALLKRLRPMPMLAFQQPCMHDANDLDCERHYVRFTGFPFFEQTAVDARDFGWHTSEIDADHLAPLTASEMVADRIARIVPSGRSTS